MRYYFNQILVKNQQGKPRPGNSAFLKSKMAGGNGFSQCSSVNKQLFEVKRVGGPKYDLANLAKTKSGKRRQSFRRNRVPKPDEGW